MKPTPTLPRARSFSGGVRVSIDPYDRREFLSDCPRWEEAFAAIEYYSASEDAAVALHLQHCPNSSAQAFKIAYPLFRAVIAQAKSFYSAAKDLHHRSAPLLFYYSFLNLAKALICIRDPSSAEARTFFQYHGLTHTMERAPFHNQKIKVNGGVFNKVYRELFGIDLPFRTEFHVLELLHYVPDVAAELLTLGKELDRRAVGQSAILADGKGQCWPFLAIGHLDILKGTNYESIVSGVIEEVGKESRFYDVFEFQLEERDHVRFYQTRKTYPTENHKLVIKDVQQTFSNLYSPLILRARHNFYLFKPIGKDGSIPMEPMIAAHCFYFYLGCLVRYHPDYLDTLLQSKEAWLIERFIRSAATSTLIRYVNSIVRQTLVFETI